MERNEDREQQTGANTGETLSNDPASAGFTEEHDRVFRSHFQSVNRLGDVAYDQVRPAYRLGFDAARDPKHEGREFEQIETDLEGGWMNVKGAGEWQSVRDYAREGWERGRKIGFISGPQDLAGTRSHQRKSYSDPVPADIDPTAPGSPEQTLDYQHEDNRGPEWHIEEVGATGLREPARVKNSLEEGKELRERAEEERRPDR